jgi:hypothetical protein
MTRYNPQTHGVHITVGWRDYDDFGTPGGGNPANQDDRIWLSLGDSVEYSPPVSPTAVLPVFTFLNDSISFSTPPSWVGEDAGSEEYFVFACHPELLENSTPSTPLSATPGGCVGLYTSDSTLSSLVAATSLPTAQALVSGSLVAYNPSAHGRNIAIQSAAKYATVPYRVTTDSQNWLGTVGGGSPTQEVTPPYTGPIVTAPAAVTFTPGGKAVLPGANLTGVSKVSVAGLDANVKVNSAGELEITVPSSLKPGVYDLVIVSDSGTLTVQGGLRVTAGSSVGATSEARPSTKLKEDNTVKVWVFDVAGAGKVQVKLNGKEVAWVNTTDTNDRKLTNGYLVRTLTLSEGKNVIEVFVGGKRVDRKAYTN